ncbi:MAG TPA: hypothetical protein VFM98_08835 [Ramlibacter sp.]|uniref:DUF7666 domain-containing protein n=1 Tax=Ramlibacter sp. TaxID=1917967 RepID=UPI002D805ED8|nr:hypothetical protein [Ramlibacter sp.]HET8745698.1 hypothetical protein [Ramlibacter sp.]
MDDQTQQPEQAEPTTIVSYKGFTQGLTCTGGDEPFQYAVGETYSMDGPIAACERGFHACEYPLDVFAYYPPAGNRFAIVEQSGEIARHEGDTKVASSRITVKAEIDLPGLIKAAVEWTFSRANPIDPQSPAHSDEESGHASATGDSGAASATGYRGAASATGESGAASATGDSGAASATGYSGAASATGRASAAMASGRYGRALAAEGCALFLVERDEDWNIVAVFAGIGGRDGIKADTWYTLEDGEPVEVEEA